MVATLSDIHSFAGSPTTPPSTVRAPGGAGDPFDRLEKLASEREWAADLLLCGGDICDHADPDGLVYAWKRLDDLAAQLGATLLATAGNHDLDSRFLRSDFDPKGALQNLIPPFPVGTIDGRDSYWARNYAIVVKDHTLVVSLNSAAFHGYHNEERRFAEFNHGRVSRHTVDQLFKDLSDLDQSNIRHHLLLCHHHPQEVGPFADFEATSVMRDAAYLLHKLETSGHEWLIVHGHRHLPFLTYAGGSAVVFSCGSFARLVGDLYNGTVGNQFYFIRLGTQSYCTATDLDIAGTFESWNWVGGDWVRAPQLRGLPPHGGFGFRGSINSLSSLMKTAVERSGGTLTWPDLVKQTPALRHVTPVDLAKLLARASDQWAALTPPLEDLHLGWPPEQVSAR